MKNINVEWCMDFIKKIFEENGCKSIEMNLFWNLAEKSGWDSETYGSPMSEALKKLTSIESVKDEDGNILYNVFTLI